MVRVSEGETGTEMGCSGCSLLKSTHVTVLMADCSHWMVCVWSNQCSGHIWFKKFGFQVTPDSPLKNDRSIWSLCGQCFLLRHSTRSHN
ncbi:hypothetical protein ACFX1T_046596 [Malus domestica]